MPEFLCNISEDDRQIVDQLAHMLAMNEDAVVEQAIRGFKLYIQSRMDSDPEFLAACHANIDQGKLVERYVG